MPRRRGMGISLIVTVVGVGVGIGVVAAAAVVADALLPVRPTLDVALPPRHASPEQIVTAYLEALNGHDCDTAAALTAAGAQASAWSWCEDVANLADIAVQGHITENPAASGHAAPAEVAYVPVTFDLSWRLLHDDGSMDEGATTWGYFVVRGSAQSKWRIFDQGVG